MAPALISILLAASATLPEPPLLLFIMPLAALFCFWRPDRLTRIPRSERQSPEHPATSNAPPRLPLITPPKPHFPTPPTHLKHH